MSDKESFSMAGDVLKTLFDRILPSNYSSAAGVFSSWEKIAGPEMALHIYPVDIVNNQLILESLHPGWSQKAEMQKERLLKKVQKRYPQLEIQKIRIVLKTGEEAHNP